MSKSRKQASGVDRGALTDPVEAKPDKDARRTRSENPFFLAELAREYYEKGRSQKKVAKEKKISQSTLSPLLQRAVEKGIVKFDINPNYGLIGVVDTERSREMRDEYRLRECLVIDSSELKELEKVNLDSRGKATVNVDFSRKAGDLHTIIANTAGERLKDTIQPGDHIVVGGGRAPKNLARFIRRFAPLLRGIRVSPLSGGIWTGSWQRDGDDPLHQAMDADDAALTLALAFREEPGTRFSRIGHPLYEEPGRVAEAIESCVFVRGGGWKTNEWDVRTPARAFVGVGVLDKESGHRIRELQQEADRELQGADRSGSRGIAKVMREALKIFKEADKIQEEYHLPCYGDVANRVFCALPLPGEIRSKNRDELEKLENGYRKLNEKLDELNRRAVVMDWGHLRGVESVWAIAGGQRKVNVLWTLLICGYLEKDRSSSVVKQLATDLETAGDLLKALKDYLEAKEKNQLIKEFYETVAPTIFEDRIKP